MTAIGSSTTYSAATAKRYLVQAEQEICRTLDWLHERVKHLQNEVRRRKVIAPSPMQDILPLHDWIAVILAGAVGGLGNVLLTGDLLWPFQYRDREGRRRVNPGLIGNLIIGAITGFVFWATYAGGADFASRHITPQTISGALLAGVGGGRILTGFVERSLQGTAVAEEAKAVAALSQQLQERTGSEEANDGSSEREAEDPGGNRTAC